MFQALQVVTVMLVAVAMALALAHAFELPGKMRLSKDAYLAMQPIYYPGFTIGGMAEPAAIVATFGLVVLEPAGTASFWLTVSALLAMLAMHAAYWILTHPVNSFWLRDSELKGAGAGFLAFDPLKRGAASPDWTVLRDRWERSHVVRAALAAIGLTLLVTAVAV
jgi:hypothetical protein